MIDSDKYASEYPLPGGVDQYFDTLLSLLRFIRDNNVSASDLSEWFFGAFPGVSGEIAVNGYISTLSRQGLWALQGNRIRLTAESAELVSTAETSPADARRMVLEIKYRRFLGYDVLFESLASGPQRLSDMLERLNEKLGAAWKSNNQVTFRVNWLRSLGYAQMEGGEYRLTGEGRKTFDNWSGAAEIARAAPQPPPTQMEEPRTPSLAKQAEEIAKRLDQVAILGGDGKEFEEATANAFRFLGFDTQLISGAGNPDVLATATMGERTYRVLIDSKSRSVGTVRQGDVDFHALIKQKEEASADFAVVVGAAFAGGNLQTFAVKESVRLLTTTEIRDLLLAHAESAFTLDVLQPLFQGGGVTDEGKLSEILASAESRSQVMRLARKVFAAVKENQDKDGAIQLNSLYWILGAKHLIPEIKLTVDFLKSDLIGAIGETERGSLYTRVTPETLTNKLTQITRAMDLGGPEEG